MRARVESEFEARLTASHGVVRLAFDGSADEPWKAIVEARDASGRASDTTVLSVSLGGGGASEEDEARDAELLLRLNVGREIRVQQRLHLLLWVEGLLQLDRLRMKAPDLWSFRLAELFFLSRADFEGMWEGDDAEVEQNHEEELAEIESRLASELLSPGERMLQLVSRADSLIQLDRPEEALRTVEGARGWLKQLEMPSDHREHLRAQLFSKLLFALYRSGRNREASERASQLRLEAERTNQRFLLRAVLDQEGSLLGVLHDPQRAAEAYGRAAKLAVELAENDGVFALLRSAGRFINLLSMWMRIGAVDRGMAEGLESERLLRTAERRSRDIRSALSVVASGRASLAFAHGRTSEGLAYSLASLEERRAIRHWLNFDDSLVRIATTLVQMGLVDEARTLAREAVEHHGRRHDALSQASWEAWSARELFNVGLADESKREYGLALATLTGIRAQSPKSLKSVEATIKMALIYGHALAELHSDAEAPRAREKATHLLTDALKLARRLKAPDHELRCHDALGEIALAAGQFDRAAHHFNWVFNEASRYMGPSALARILIDLGRVEHARGAWDAALKHFDRARKELERPPPLYLDRYAWKRLMVERHKTERASGDLAAAKWSLDAALSVLRAEGLRIEEMEVLHQLAELPPASNAEDHRIEAAMLAQEIAREALFPSDEARATLSIVAVEVAAGRRDAVEGQFREAAWIARELGPRDLRRRAEELARSFEPTA